MTRDETGRSVWRCVPENGAGVAARVVGGDGALVGMVLSFNAIEDAEPEVLESPGVMFVRSGWPGPDSPPAWLPGQRAKAMMGLDALERVAHGRQLCVWPRAGDAISDVPSLLTFLRGHAHWKFVLDAAALLTTEMEGRAGEHWMRMLEALGGQESLMGVVVPGAGHVLEASVGGGMFAPGVAMMRVEAASAMAK